MIHHTTDLERQQAAEIERLTKDAQRYRWLRGRLLAADFEWGDPAVPVLVFSWPADVGVGGDCDMNIDAAMKEQP